MDQKAVFEDDAFQIEEEYDLASFEEEPEFATRLTPAQVEHLSAKIKEELEDTLSEEMD